MKSSSTGLVFKTLLGLGIAAVVLDIVFICYNGYWHVNALYGGPAFFFWRGKFVDKKLTKAVYKPIKPNEHDSAPELVAYLDVVEKEADAANGVYPYYAFGLPDTFVLDVKNTWTLFRDSAVLALERRFLVLRAQFIQAMLKIKLEGGKYADNSAFRTGGSRKTAQFVKMPKDAVRAFFADPQHNTLIDSVAFNAIVAKVLARTPDYFVQMAEDGAGMSSALEKDVMALVTPVLQPLGIDRDAVNAWFLRLATVKAGVYDAHVLNRLYWYFFYNHNYLDAADAGSSLYAKLHDELAVLEALPKDAVTDEKTRKMTSLRKKMDLLRTEMVLTKFSQLMARLLGTEGELLGPGHDKRPLLRRPHSPKLATAKDFRKDSDYKGEPGLFERDMRDFLHMDGN